MNRGTAVSYRVFVRNWWRRNDTGLPGLAGLTPDPGARKTTIATHCTLDEAQDIAMRYNETHAPGRLSRKAEFTSE